MRGRTSLPGEVWHRIQEACRGPGALQTVCANRETPKAFPGDRRSSLQDLQAAHLTSGARSRAKAL